SSTPVMPACSGSRSAMPRPPISPRRPKRSTGCSRPGACEVGSVRPSTSPTRPKPTGPLSPVECGAGSSSSPDRDADSPCPEHAEGALSPCLLCVHLYDRPLRAVEDLTADETEQCRPLRDTTACADHRQLCRVGPRLKNFTQIV